MKKRFILMLFLFIPMLALANAKILNIYVWAGEIPDSAIRAFEKETGIKVNYSTYDSNETMYAKLSAVDNPGYDIIEPSSYYLDRLRREHKVQKIPFDRIPNMRYLDKALLNKPYDPLQEYSMPYFWGVTGIFVNTQYHDIHQIQSWHDFWQPGLKNQLLILNDLREAFSMSLISLDLSANATDLTQIQQAYQNLRNLQPNIKLYADDAVISVITDEDSTIGMAWNGDVFKASQDNPNIQFVFPKEGFVAWVDCLAIPVNAPHFDNAVQFLNFLQRPDINAKIILEEGYATANLEARKLLPDNYRNSKVIFPEESTMQRATFQKDMNDKALAHYAYYWELLKMGD